MRNSESGELRGVGLPIAADEWQRAATTLKLSPREAAIAEILIVGNSEAQAAKMLGISRHTVHAHVKRIFRKVGVRSRVQLANRIFLEGRGPR